MEPWLVAIGSLGALLVASIVAIHQGRVAARVRVVAGGAPGSNPLSTVAALRTRNTELVLAQGVVSVADGRVVSAVADRGVGIPKTAQARIFERFYKVDRARGRGETGGTGLGLPIARHIIDQHGGTIWVESEEGTGSTFRFDLPIADTSI